MMNLTVEMTPTQTHECTGFREGDWMIFKCTICHDYERRLNWRTGRMTTKSDPENPFQHTGSVVPTRFWSFDQNAN